ncbi:hypothetical protein E2L07_16155 [Halalkalibacterium halodurans]|uniref:hypothetical protein n=1 Tax=Halalkalibacterium halodurans TaxID=86665 RepID=UPI001067C68D|nr:hypothetical protein [Halalkalibacterium halodurans]TES50324.1 hypothetical protein E2L07_16155 [Halalkalibacterium halodurans]
MKVKEVKVCQAKDKIFNNKHALIIAENGMKFVYWVPKASIEGNIEQYKEVAKEDFKNEQQVIIGKIQYNY